MFKQIFNEKIIDFMEIRKITLLLSMILIIGSIFSFFIKGFNWGVDFAGGTIVQIKYEKQIELEEVRKKLNSNEKYLNSTVTNFGSAEEIIIKLKTTESSIENNLNSEIKELLNETGEFEIRRIDIVGPKVGSELTEKGLLSMGLSLLAILIYVAFRFELKFSFASIMALVHDVTITLGILSLFQIEINLDILAALLTLIGYSLNDTIIVFDRIREELKETKENILYNLINNSINKTLTRTTITSLTTFIVILTLFVFGSEMIYGFSFTLLVGIIIGTYSSIFIAANLLIETKFSIESFRKKELEKEKLRIEKQKLREMYEGGIV